MGECGNAGSVADGGDGGSLWWFGVLLSVVSSILSNLGVNTQKLSLMREATRPATRRRPYARQRLWQLGLVLVIVGSLGDFAALGFAAQSLVTPVGAVTMVANLFFASLWLGEHLSASDLGATFLILVGAVLAAAFADKSEQCYTLDELVELYSRIPFLIYVASVVLVSLIFFFLSRRCEMLKRRHGVDSLEYGRYKKIHPFCYALLSGMLGAQSVLFAKSTAELFERSVAGDFQFHKPVSWAILVAMLCCIFSQLHWMAKGLEHFDALYIVPVFQCFFITVAILGGGVYFEELSNFSTVQAVMFPTGVLLTIIGVFILTQRDDSTDGTDDDVRESKPEQTQEESLRQTTFADDCTTSNQQLQRASSMSSLESTNTRSTRRRLATLESDRMHVSQMSLRPSLALSVAGSVGSISASLKAALKAAGEQADRGGTEVSPPSSTDAVRIDGIEYARRSDATEASIVQFAQRREDELRQQAAAFRVSDAPPPSRSTGASLRNGGQSMGSGFMSLHSLNENSISAGLKAALKAAGEKADREAAQEAATAEGKSMPPLPQQAWGEEP